MLTEKTNAIIEEVNELTEIFMKQFSTDMFENMEGDEFVAMKKTFKLMDRSMDLALEQAKVMDAINEKLDKLLAMKEEGSN